MTTARANMLRLIDQFSTVKFEAASSRNIAHLATREEFVRLLREAVAPFSFKISYSQHSVTLSGDGPATLIAGRTLERLAASDSTGAQITHRSVCKHIDDVIEAALKRELVCYLPGLRQAVVPLSLAQIAFLNDLLEPNCPLVFGIGPAATGKTHIAIAAGMSLLASGDVRHVVITKPHEMLEGELTTPKIRAETDCDEQFERLRDILDDLVGYDKVKTLEAERRLEMIPLGAMRGRVFNRSFIIVDEAHHANVRRMRLAVTRAGIGSRMAVMGDPLRERLRSGEDSGLSHLLSMVRDAQIGKIHQFQPSRTIRTETVKRLEALYEKEDTDRFVEVILPSEDAAGNIRY